MIKVVNKRWDRGMNRVYIGRPSIFGNPYSHLDDTIAKFKVSSREESVESYKSYFDEQMLTNSLFAKEFEKLYKKWKEDGYLFLVCWCKPYSCHGDYILDKLKAYDVIVGTSFD